MSKRLSIAVALGLALGAGVAVLALARGSADRTAEVARATPRERVAGEHAQSSAARVPVVAASEQHRSSVAETRADAPLAEVPLSDGVAVLSGRVVFEHGEPVAGARVTAWRVGAWREPRLSAVSDEQGRFRIEAPLDPAVEWIASCRVGVASASATQLRLPDDGVELRLPSLGRVGLRLVERGSGVELGLAGLRWCPAGEGRWRRVPSDALDPPGGQDGVRWIRVPLGLVDFRATADADRHFAGVLQNVPVIAGSAQVWEIELERGIELWLGFTTRAGEVAHHLGPTMLERDGSRLSAIDSRAGRDLYAPLRPGVYTLIGFGGFAFAPAAVELSAELHQELDVTWWIADAAAYAELLAAQEKFEEAVKAGLVGPGDY